jgi:hypothetical protein
MKRQLFQLSPEFPRVRPAPLLVAATALLLLSPLAARAQPSAEDARFEQLRGKSEPLGGLGAFLERYVGACSEPEGRAECRATAETYRQKVAGKRFAMLVGEEQAGMLAPGPYDPESGALSVLVTPLFGANGLALSGGGAPKKADAAGNPLMPRLNATGSTTESYTPARFQRLFAQRELQVEVVFTPEAVWSLGSGNRQVRGVRAKLHGLRIVLARTGETLATWFPG